MKLPKLYLLLTGDGETVLERAQLALATGVKLLQLRLKDVSDRVYYELARELARLCRQRGAHLIVNDRVDIGLASGASGVHLGEEDLPLSSARKICPSHFWLGRTVRSLEDAERAVRAGATYLGVGAAFPSSTKSSVPVIGPQKIAQIAQAVPIPVFAIGGISRETLPELPLPPIYGVALSSGVWSSSAPQKELAFLLEALC